MPTQKGGFLFSFLSAFRAHSQPLPKQTPSRPPAGTTQTLWTSAPTTTKPHPTPSSPADAIASPRPINPKTPHHAYTTASSTSPPPTTELRPALQHNVSPATHLPRCPPSPGLPVYGPPNKPSPSYPTAVDSRRRRGSDSSSDSGGFREVRAGGAEKWFVGGRTPGGEEKYYKLSMVKRERSSDRISADRLSL